MATETPHRVVIIGCGFAGLFATYALRRAPVTVTIIDRTNHHLFQPLLYQMATGILSEGDIAPPIREIFRRQRNARVVLGEVVKIDVAAHEAPGMKSIDDALELRARIFGAFEAAEVEPDPERRRRLMTFVVVGAGAT